MNLVLAIAEEQGVCASLRAILSSQYTVLFEPDITSAERRLTTMQPSVLLVDDYLNLDEETMRSIKALAPQVPLVVLSARQDALTMAGFVLAGAAVVVPKPFNEHELLEALQSLAPTAAPPREVREFTAMEQSNTTMLSQYQTAMRWLSRCAAKAQSLSLLAGRLVEASEDIFDAARCAVLVEQGDVVRIVASQGIAPELSESLTLRFSSGLMRWFDEHPCIFECTANVQAVDAEKEMQFFGGVLAAPLMRNGRVFGALVLGEKTSGAAYYPGERDLLSQLTRAASAALEQRQAWKATQHNEVKLVDTLNHLPAGIIIVKADKSISSLNAAAARLLYLEAEGLPNRNVQKLGSAVADAVLRTMDDKVPQTATITLPGGRGLRKVETNYQQDGTVIVMVTKQEEARVEVAEVAHSPFWEYLSQRVAQEIKNPMVAVNTFAQLLPRKYDSEDFRDAFSRVVQEEVERINQVVETLFEFASAPELILKHHDLNATMKEVLKNFEDEIASKSINLETDWAAELMEAEIDLAYFQEATGKVLRNAIDAMPEGGTLTVSTARENGSAKIRIADTGSGMEEEDRENATLPFFSTKEQGMGLGLPLAGKILELHHGEIEIEEGETEGTCVTLRVPAWEHDDDPGRETD